MKRLSETLLILIIKANFIIISNCIFYYYIILYQINNINMYVCVRRLYSILMI